jgi:hypothetical protein
MTIDTTPLPDSYYSAPVHGASASGAQHWEQFVSIPSVQWLHLRSEKLRLDHLASLSANWDGRGSAAPSQNAVQRASQVVLPLLYEAASVEVAGWAAPHITASEAGEVVFEWWQGSRKLTLYISDARVEYIKVGGADIDNEMETGAIVSERDFIPLWAWLHA